jgi:hypothetical protein
MPPPDTTHLHLEPVPPAARRERTADALADVSVVITNYNGRGVLESTLRALVDLGLDESRIILVDDGSSDDSVAWMAAEYPRAQVVAFDQNTRRLNTVRNRGLRAAPTRYVFLIDNDITVLPGCIDELMRVMRSRPGTLCCTPRLLHRDAPDRIFQDGARLHFLGLSSGQRRDVPAAEHPAGEPVETFGGGVMLIDRDLAGDIGCFDECYALSWADDGEFQLRGRMVGFRALHVPAATCLHLRRPRGRARVYGQLYNRYRLIATCYAARTLVLLAPALLAFELALTVASLPGRFAFDRLRAVRAVWRHRRSLRRHRRHLQAKRRVPDRDLMGGGRLELPGIYAGRPMIDRLVTAVSAVADSYWALVRHLL